MQTVVKKINPASYDTVLSAEPLWQLANTHLPEDARFPEPAAELTTLHRRVNGNLSRFMRGDIRQVLVAHLMMELCTVVSKQEDIFGRDQGVAGGGPYLMCSRTIFRPPDTLNQHAETHVKGFCQLSKTFETCVHPRAEPCTQAHPPAHTPFSLCALDTAAHAAMAS